jgi:hypothetical protein
MDAHGGIVLSDAGVADAVFRVECRPIREVAASGTNKCANANIKKRYSTASTRKRPATPACLARSSDDVRKRSGLAPALSQFRRNGATKAKAPIFFT